MNKQSGFTLVEIAIVLVIIGLLLGGVLKGQELITQAKIKNIANDLNGMTAAVYGYQDRYKRLPGDDEGAAARWTNPLAVPGDGNAQVGAPANAGVIDCSTSVLENCQFWHHLRLAGFIGGDTAAGVPGRLSPQNASGGILQVQQGALGLSGLAICTTNLLGKIANAIDAQFDDGNPATGQVRGIAAVAGAYVLNAPPAAGAYVDDGATVYAVCKQI
ncbi:MAG: prepilin-type N-terminal cleavage/methylation domain-containing protein [Rhodocyclaceae bacterium]|nr:prepilin-type N-terminal cleavage/methylation domain-containing protein [Rhodocyclaceae bacterium]